VIDDKFSKTLSSDEVVAVKKKYGYDSNKKMLLI